MTIYNFALFSKTCNRCNRTFILEKYRKAYIEVGIECRSIPVCVCKKCLDKELENVEYSK